MNEQHKLMKYFSYEHLPGELKIISRKFHDLALDLDANLPCSEEKDMVFRKLLEAKDCAVRSKLK